MTARTHTLLLDGRTLARVNDDGSTAFIPLDRGNRDAEAFLQSGETPMLASNGDKEKPAAADPKRVTLLRAEIGAEKVLQGAIKAHGSAAAAHLADPNASTAAVLESAANALANAKKAHADALAASTAA